MIHLGLQMIKDLFPGVPLSDGYLNRENGGAAAEGVGRIGHKLGGHLGRRQLTVNQTGADGVLLH